MTQPLALLFYERLLPGTQLVNRLQDLHYRVQTVADARALAAAAQECGPMLVFVDCQPAQADILAAIKELRAHPATAHLPIIGFVDNDASDPAQTAGQQAGASLVVQDHALLNHLPQLLEKALHTE